MAPDGIGHESVFKASYIFRFDRFDDRCKGEIWKSFFDVLKFIHVQELSAMFTTEEIVNFTL